MLKCLLAFPTILLLFFSAPLSFAEALATPLYSGERSYPPGWFELSWGGARPAIEPQVHRPDEKASLAILVSDLPEHWCGAGIHVLEARQGLALKSGDLEKAHLVFEVNGGVRPDGTREGGQAANVTIGLQNGKGDKLGPEGGALPFLALEEFLEDGTKSIDDDADTWQTVRIPLKRFALEGTDGAEFLTSFAIQFREKPSSGLYITRIRLERP